MEKYFSEKKTLLFLVGFVILLLILPNALRYNKIGNIKLGDQTFFHERISRDLFHSDFTKMNYQDNHTFFQRTVKLNPHYFLLWLGNSVWIDSRILSLILGIISSVLFFLILKKIDVSLEERIFMLLALILSPLFVFTFTVCTPHASALFFGLLGFCLFMQKSNIIRYLSILFLVLASTYSIIHSILIVILILAYVVYFQDKKRIHIVSIVGALDLILIVIFKLPMFLQTTFIEIPGYIVNMISDLGGKEGFGIFTILLTIIGFFYSWKHKKRFAVVYFLFGFLFLLSFKLHLDVNIYLNMIVAIISGYGFYRLYKLEWTLLDIKNIFLLVVLCGLLFSTLSYINRISEVMPDNYLHDAAIFLKDENGTILTHPAYGSYLELVSSNVLFFDSMNFYLNKEEVPLYMNITQELFYSYKLKETREILKKYNIKYILVTEEMKTGRTWEKDDQGLLFLFQNNETFKNRFNSSKIDIWEVIDEEV